MPSSTQTCVLFVINGPCDERLQGPPSWKLGLGISPGCWGCFNTEPQRLRNSTSQLSELSCLLEACENWKGRETGLPEGSFLVAEK